MEENFAMRKRFFLSSSLSPYILREYPLPDTTAAMKTNTRIRWGSSRTVVVTVFAALLAGCHAPPKQAAPIHEASVKPGINDDYRSGDIPKWQGRLEAESREVYRERERIVAAAGIRKGETVADIGAGTGLLTVLLARSTGPTGTVYGEDIIPEFVKHLGDRAAAEGLGNVVPTLGKEDSAELPRGSIDVAFICDTYHHFEYPKTMMRTIHEALRPGGRLVIVDFERIPGVSSEWILNHVRAGRAEVEAELRDAGFVPLEVQPDTSFLKENWMAIFRRVEGAGR